MEKNMDVYSIRIPKALSLRLKILSTATKRPKSYFIRECLERTIEDLEDAYLAETGYEEFLKSGSDSISLEYVEQKLGLAN